MGEFDYKSRTSLEDGIFSHGKFELPLSEDNVDIPLPVKTIPVKKCSPADDIYPGYKRINEVYHSIDSFDLRNAIYEDNPDFIDSIKEKQKYSDPGQLDLVLLDYDETKPMTGMEAQEYVRAIDEVSDIITPPMQTGLLYSIIDSNNIDSVDDPFANLLLTNENFLEETAELDSEKPIMGALSFLSGRQLNQLITLFDDFDVEMVGVDLYRTKPTSSIDDDLGEVIGRLTAADLFDSSVMYGYNMQQFKFRGSPNIRRAEDFALVGMGFDIIGGNHVGLNIRGSGDRANYSIFDPDIVGYQPIPVNEIEDEWPNTVQSKIRPQRLDELKSDKAGDLAKLVSAGQIQRALMKFRQLLDEGNGENYLKTKVGIDETMVNAFKTALSKRRDWTEPGPGAYSES